MFEKDCCYCVNAKNLGEISLNDLRDVLKQINDDSMKFKLIKIEGTIFIQWVSFPEIEIKDWRRFK